MMFPGDRRSPTRASFGTASLSTSSLLVCSSVPKLEKPVTFPPGRARLATKPPATGSVLLVNRMGMVVVARLAANAAIVPVTTIRSTLRRTRSAASSGRRLFFPSVNRYSMVIFFPSIQPSLRTSCQNASRRSALPEAVVLSRTPMRGTFPACCAPTEPQSAKSMAQSVRIEIFLFMFFSALSTRHSSLDTRPFSFDQPTRPGKHLRRNC